MISQVQNWVRIEVETGIRKGDQEQVCLKLWIGFWNRDQEGVAVRCLILRPDQRDSD